MSKHDSVSETVGLRKHPCPDCSMCQGCPETRCGSCRSAKGCVRPGRKLSIAEQIALFNSLNPDLDARDHGER